MPAFSQLNPGATDIVTKSAPYEPGMRIGYDSKSKQVTVTFRGRVTTLNGEYETERAAIKAGEEYCRRNGWVDKPPPTLGRSMLKKHIYNLD